MRRYIIGALLALSTLCSCVLDYGSSARPEDVNDILYSRVRSYISAVKDQSRFVILTDVLQNGSEAELQFVKSRYFDGYKITVLEDRVILWRDHENSFSRYVIMTDKKPLSEGGEWSVLLENELSTAKKLSSVKGVVGAERSFTIYYDRDSNNEDTQIELTVEYIVATEQTNIIATEFSGEGTILGDNDEYIINFNIHDDDPIIYRESLYQSSFLGMIDISYKDFIDNKTREFTASVNPYGPTYQ